MTAETHSQLATFIWSICNLLRGPYKRNEYRNDPIIGVRDVHDGLAYSHARGSVTVRKPSFK